jgi:hypothetical protein
VEKREKQPDTLKENAGKVFIDLGKLMFGSFILGGVLRGEVPQFMIVLSGFAGAVTFIGIGLLWTTKKKDEKKE